MTKILGRAWMLATAAMAVWATAGAEVGPWEVFETSYTTSRTYPNPFTDLEVDVVFEGGGRKWTVPAFWVGGGTWTVRFAAPAEGEYRYRVECSDPANTDFAGKERVLRVGRYTGNNALLRHGFPRVAATGRHFEHADGTAFFWLADTWWKNLCRRLTWEGFQELTADRKAKGFSVVQIVCGPYPDEGFLQPRWGNEGGIPYSTTNLSVVNPAYFEFADRRLQHLIRSGIAPAIVGAWGRSDCNSMEAIGLAGLKRHWRHLVARYGAYPVFWILAGEIGDETKWGQGAWAEVARYLREIDPYHHPLTCHTARGRRGRADDTTVIDFDMVGGSHDEKVAITAQTLSLLTAARDVLPAMPVLVGETCYEGHMQQGFGDVQRRIFWMNLLSGAAGHTYGAAGIWHAGVEGDAGVSGAFGGQVYDWTTWKEGMGYPGAAQLGLGRKLLERFPWWRFERRTEWTPDGCFAAGTPGEVRLIYVPRRGIYDWAGPEVRNLDPGVVWRATYFDPATGRTFDLGEISVPAATVVFRRNLPSPQDWVLVFERIGTRQP